MKTPRHITPATIRSLTAAFALVTLFVPLVQPLFGQAQGTRTNGLDPGGIKEIDAAVEKAISDGKMPGAVVLIGNRQGVLFSRAYGNRATRPVSEPMTAETVFDLASLTKPVATATSVMILIEQGKLSLRDRVGKFIPEIEDDSAKRVTVEQLLTHTSGYRPDFDLGEKWSGREGMLEALYRERLRNPPGTVFVYSDIGFIVLGEIVHRVSGKRLDAFSSEWFRSLGMRSTGFNPIGELPLSPRPEPGSVERMIAPTESLAGQQGRLGATFEGTEEEGKRVLRGEVHDPTAYRMGGVAGHAGLFSSADDLAVYCLMILGGGGFSGKRLLSSASVSRMTAPLVVSEAGDSRGLGWDIDTSFSSNRGSLFPKGSFGHTGFTGTGIWIDPVSGVFVIFLSNRVHPDGKGDIAEVRAAVSTIAAASVSVAPDQFSKFESEHAAKVAVQVPAFRALRAAAANGTVARRPSNAAVLNGIDLLERERFDRLKGMKVGLVTNHTGRNLKGRSTTDLLAEAEGVSLEALFSPEHGIRGELDREGIGDSTDEKTGVPIFSLYGETRRPRQENLAGLDALVFDVQDIGTRFYTYISTLRYVMEEAAASGIPLFVLDRPNPVNGLAVEGMPADEGLLSFTAAHTIPVRHGMTVGELAMLMNAERKIGADIRVVKMEGWRRAMWFDETGQTWVNPSPNMRSLTQAVLYPGIGLLETTNVSVGRGTDTPFEMLGAPWIDGRALAAALNRERLPGVRFVPVEFTPKASVHAGQKCGGVNIVVTDRTAFEPVRTGTVIALALRSLYPSDWKFSSYSRLLANDESFVLIEGNEALSEFEKRWELARDRFLSRRTAFLLYN